MVRKHEMNGLMDKDQKRATLLKKIFSYYSKVNFTVHLQSSVAADQGISFCQFTSLNTVILYANRDKTMFYPGDDMFAEKKPIRKNWKSRKIVERDDNEEESQDKEDS